jgi:ERCC4-related helicase
MRIFVSVAAKNSRITPTIKVRQGEATKCIDDFREGTINVIVATSVIEEVSEYYVRNHFG